MPTPIENKTENTDQNQVIFYEYFIAKVAKEFSQFYLLNTSDLFHMFQVNSIKEIFKEMSLSDLGADKFFISYFKESFHKYIEYKKSYVSDLNLTTRDLTFQEYLHIIENSFKQIESDIKSIKELYSLFKSFIDLFYAYKGEIG